MAGAAVLAKALAKEWRKVNATLHAQRAAPESEPVSREKLKTLRRDPRTGIYRAE
jgi:hypothetical protein